MRPLLGRALMLAAIGAVAGGCATPVYEDRYSYDDGWRPGTVTDVGSGDTITRRATRDCRAQMPRESVLVHGFARVAYYNARNLRAIIVPIGDTGVSVAQSVYINTIDCYLAVAVGSAP